MLVSLSFYRRLLSPLNSKPPWMETAWLLNNTFLVRINYDTKGFSICLTLPACECEGRRIFLIYGSLGACKIYQSLLLSARKGSHQFAPFITSHQRQKRERKTEIPSGETNMKKQIKFISLHYSYRYCPLEPHVPLPPTSAGVAWPRHLATTPFFSNKWLLKPRRSRSTSAGRARWMRRRKQFVKSSFGYIQ